MKFEYAIRQKMKLLKKDWKEFLKTGYPELFTDVIDESNSKSRSNSEHE